VQARLEALQNLQQIGYRRPLTVIHVDPQVAHDPFLVDHQCCRMRNLPVAGIILVENPILPDRAGARINQEREVRSLGVAKLAQLLSVVMSDGPDNGLSGLNGFDGVLQLAELRAAVRSPGAAEEDNDDILLTLQSAQA